MKKIIVLAIVSMFMFVGVCFGQTVYYQPSGSAGSFVNLNGTTYSASVYQQGIGSQSYYKVVTTPYGTAVMQGSVTATQNGVTSFTSGTSGITRTRR